MENKSGYLRRVVYREPSSGFVVGTFRALDSSGKPTQDLTVVGSLPDVEPDYLLEIAGNWEDNAKHGRQFRVCAAAGPVPTTKGGIERYLSSCVSGCGPVRASAIVNYFDGQTAFVLENQPERLSEVGGIGDYLAEQIGRSWKRDRSERRLGIFLAAAGVNPNWAKRIYDHFGVESYKIVQSNPYRLSEVEGVGFKTADRIAKSLGWKQDSPQRVEAVFSHLLEESRNEGDVCLPKSQLLERAVDLSCAPLNDVQAALDHVIARKSLIEETVDSKYGPVPLVYLPYLLRAEKGLVARIHCLLNQDFLFSDERFEECLSKAQEGLQIELTAEQQSAVRTGIAKPLSVITGSPGTGKTTCTQVLVNVAEMMGARVLLAASTGRAAKRLSELSNRPAQTIHRLCEFSPLTYTFQRNSQRPLECEVLIIDESSMMDIQLAHALLDAVPKGCSVVLIGDHNQLPAVGPGMVLRDLIASGRVPVMKFGTIFRQSQGSVITLNAHRIIRGEVPSFLPFGEVSAGLNADSYFVEAPTKQGKEDAAWVLSRVAALCKNEIPKLLNVDSIRDIQVLAPMKKHGAGVYELNKALQDALNPEGQKVLAGGTALRIGDRVVQTRNDYSLEIFNGDIGFIEDAQLEDKLLRINFYGRKVFYPFDQMHSLMPAYAQTIHRSQGSEYPAVVVVLMKSHYVMLNRNLLYTAATRARRLAVFVGSQAAVEMAVKNNQSAQRTSLLRWRLKNAS